MKLKIVFLLFLLLIILNGCSSSKTEETNQNDQYYIKVFDKKHVDVDGDLLLETIELTGKVSPGSPHYCMGKSRLKISKGGNLIIEKEAIGELFPTIEFIGDILNNGSTSILLRSMSNGNGSPPTYNQIFCFKNGLLEEVTFNDVEDSRYLSSEVIDKDRVAIHLSKIGYEVIAPLTEKQQLSLNAKDGEKNKDSKKFGYFKRLGTLEVDDVDNDNILELAAKTQILSIAIIKTYYKYNNGVWEPIKCNAIPIHSFLDKVDLQKRITSDDLFIDNIGFDFTYSMLNEIYGDDLINTKSSYYQSYTYNVKREIAFVVNEETQKVRRIEAFGGKHFTPRGLVVGNSRSEVLELYGKPDVNYFNDKWFYSIGENEFELEIIFENEKVKYFVLNS